MKEWSIGEEDGIDEDGAECGDEEGVRVGDTSLTEGMVCTRVSVRHCILVK